MACNIHSWCGFFLSYKRDGIQLSLHLLELMQKQNPGLGSEEIAEGAWKNPTCWCWQVWETSNGKISKILLCSSVEGVSLVASAGFEAVNKLPVFLLGNSFSVYAEILLFNTCFCKTLLKWFKLLLCCGPHVQSLRWLETGTTHTPQSPIWQTECFGVQT